MRVAPSCLGVPLSILVSAAAGAQVPVGPEFRVNTYLTGSQVRPSVGVDGAGNFVVVWATAYPPSDLRGQRFDRSGSPRGAEFVVHASTFLVRDPKVAVDAAGGFTVVWSRVPQSGSFNQNDVMARLYDAAGDPRGAEFLVNTYTTGAQDEPSIASQASGAFVVVWTSGSSQDGAGAGVFGQRFDADGTRLGAEFVVPSQTGGNELEPAVATGEAGDFVVVWRSAFGGGMASSVAGQRFTPDGLRIGGEFQVSALSTSHPHYPAVAAAPGGDFMVAWSDNYHLPPKLLARRYDGAGVPRGPETTAHVFSGNALWRVAVSAGAGGRFVILWYDARPAPSSGLELLGRRFDAVGGPLGRAFRVSAATAGLQASPAVAADAAGNLLVAWFYVPPQSAEGDIHARRCSALLPQGMNVDVAGGPGSDGNRVLEPGETVEVRPAWRNQTGAALSLVGSLSGITGPPGATYSVVDGTADYGVVANGGTQECLDCYAVGVTAPPVRPAFHWDALAIEGFEAGEEGHTDWPLHVGGSFTDVPRTSGFYRSVETLLHRGVTAGCGASLYCPIAATTREQMAVFLLAAEEGAGYVPPACTAPVFGDVPASSPFCRWIEELARRGVTGGCGGGNYCPTAAVSREQMAVFVLRTLDPALDPPSCTPPNLFGDVPENSAFCRWIEELARRGIVSGCGGGNYCPTAPVTREQMAVFLTGTFGLTLYGP